MAFHYIKNFPRYTGIHLFLPFPLSILPSSREIKQFKSAEDAATMPLSPYLLRGHRRKLLSNLAVKDWLKINEIVGRALTP